ncbi:terminase [Streptomyces sp. SPB78]|nr:terminase [Streptomyces sp. SPB78]
MGDEEIEAALAARPLTVAFQADEQLGAWFDIEAASRAVRAIESFKHTKGRWGGTALKLDPWQKLWVILPLFGWLFWDDEVDAPVRVIRTAWVEVPRKAGKSTLSSGISLTLLLADREIGAEVYSAAGSLDQAKRVFDDAKRMAVTSRAVRGRVDARAAALLVPRTGGVLRALSKIAETAHGLNVSGGVIDEVHVHKKRDLVDAIETGTGARTQPLIVFITTADEGDEGTIYDEKHTYTERCAEHVVEDPSHFGVVWAAEPGDDPFDEATWRKANPGLGTSPTVAYLRKEAAKAKVTPSYFPTFCRLHLNLRMRSRVRWLPMPLWDANQGPVSAPARLRLQPAWGGLDLSAVSDLSAWVLVVKSRQPGVELEMLPRFWLPEERVDDLAHQLQVPLHDWVTAGLLTLTEGDAIDYAAIEDQILADSRAYRIQRVSYDRMFAGGSLQRIEANPRIAEVTPIPQTYLGMGPGAKEVERLLRERALRHDGHQVMRWNASCVEVIRDGNDNLRPVKPKRDESSARVDGIAALVMAVDGYLRRKTRRDEALSA